MKLSVINKIRYDYNKFVVIVLEKGRNVVIFVRVVMIFKENFKKGVLFRALTIEKG